MLNFSLILPDECKVISKHIAMGTGLQMAPPLVDYCQLKEEDHSLLGNKHLLRQHTE